MNWEALGAIAELVGAIGMIATLGDLAVQIRQNTSVVRTANYQSLMSDYGNLASTFADNAEATAIYDKGLRSYAGLSAIEKLRFQWMMAERFGGAQMSFVLQRRGHIRARSRDLVRYAA